MGAAILHETGTIRSLPNERARLVVSRASFRKRSAADRARELKPRKPHVDCLRDRFGDRIGRRRVLCRSDNAKGRGIGLRTFCKPETNRQAESETGEQRRSDGVYCDIDTAAISLHSGGDDCLCVAISTREAADRRLCRAPRAIWYRSSIGALFWSTTARVHEFGRRHLYRLRANSNRGHFEHVIVAEMAQAELTTISASHGVQKNIL